jgi:hypothetical protein
MVRCLVAAIVWTDQTVLFRTSCGWQTLCRRQWWFYRPNTGIVGFESTWGKFRVHVRQKCVCVCVSNRISEIAVCKPSTRESRPRSVRSATQTWKEVNLWLCLIKLDILKRKKEMEVKLHAFLNSDLVRVCTNPQMPAVLWTWWPSVRLNMAAKRTFPVLSRNVTHYKYMVIYDCCSCCV